MTTSVSISLQPTTTPINERIKDCMVSTYLEKSQNEANKLNKDLNCARRALSFYNRENKTKILMLALVIILVIVLCLITVFFSRRR
mgnify:CR=1 FL=1